jgi:hypothetical protein
MSYQSFKVSTADLESYYLPKSFSYDLMLSSINSNGYGQIIYNYYGPGNFQINSYNVWDGELQSMVVKTPDLSTTYTESQAGPALWNVDSATGIQFLQDITDIVGLAKLKYCNSCQGRNGLPRTTISNFSNRFVSLDSMKRTYDQKYGYLFYDYDFANNQDWYISVYDPTFDKYVFKNYLGTQKNVIQVSEETGIPAASITASLQSAEPIIPIVCDTIELSYSTTPNNVCDLVQLQYNYDSINNVLYINESCGSQTAAIGYYSDGKSIFYWDGVNFDKFNICARSSTIRHCCNETVYVIDGVYPVGTVLYTKDVFPAECFQVISVGTDDPTTSFNFTEYRGGCIDCTASYGGGCGGSGSSGGGR